MTPETLSLLLAIVLGAVVGFVMFGSMFWAMRSGRRTLVVLLIAGIAYFAPLPWEELEKLVSKVALVIVIGLSGFWACHYLCRLLTKEQPPPEG